MLTETITWVPVAKRLPGSDQSHIPSLAGGKLIRRSACASPENFDAELGRKIARQHALSKIWPLMGYALRERLAQEATR